MSLIGFQVVALRRGDEDVFELAGPPPALEPDADAREALALPEGYAHRAVRLRKEAAPADQLLLAAFPVGGDGSQGMLELDENGRPLPASDAALTAIGIGNGLLAGELPAGDVESVRAHLIEIATLVGADETALRDLLFQRLYPWLSGEGLAGELPEVFWLIPWADLEAHLGHLIELLRIAKRSDEPLDDEPRRDLPELSHSFRWLMSGLAPALREITEWRERGSPIDNHRLSVLAERLRRLEVGRVPPFARPTLTDAVEAIGRKFQTRLPQRKSSSDHAFLCQGMVDVYETLMRFEAPFEGSRELGDLKWMGRVAVAAHAGSYPFSRLRVRRQTVERLREAAERFLAKSAHVDRLAESEERKVDRRLDAAFVQFFAATVALRIEREPQRGLELAHAAREGFERFGEEQLPYRVPRWGNAFPEVCLLEARAASAVGEHAAAGAALRAMWDFLKGPFFAERRRDARDVHLAELQLALDEVVRHDERTAAWARDCDDLDVDDLAGAARALSKQVIERNFTRRRAWRFFLANTDPVEGVRQIEHTLEANLKTKGLEQTAQDTLSWLEFQLAVTARQRAEEMPELMLEAFLAYVHVLVSQPTNTLALVEVFDIYSELEGEPAAEARQTLGSRLRPMDDSNVPVTHAALRWAILGEVPGIEAGRLSLAHAIPVLGAGEAAKETMDAANRMLESGVARAGAKQIRLALELVSKWVYEDARARADRERFEAVARLLDPAIAGLPEDPVWWTRRAEVAIAQQDVDAAEALLEEIAESFRDDAIAQLQRARLLLLKGDLARADETLATAAKIGDGSPHPAISDRRGFIALREGRFGDAEDVYLGILAENPADPDAHYGLGRVYRDNPDGSTMLALREWQIALRLRATAGDASLRRRAWHAAAAIAALVNEQVAAGQADDALDAVENMLTVEDPAVSRYVVNALRVRGVTDAAVAGTLREAQVPRLAQALAQYLMARTIHVFVETPDRWPAFIEGDLPEYVEWCRREGVLGDFLAGAKGSYARAQIRSSIRRIAAPSEVEAPVVKARKLKKLVGHVLDTAYSSEYYTDAYKYIRSARGASHEQLVDVARAIVETMAIRTRVDLDFERDAGRSRDSALTSLQPSVGLEPIGTALRMEGGAANVAGYVDLDALLFARFTKGMMDWRLEGTQVTGVTSQDLSPAERRGYNRAGLLWDVAESEGQLRCSVSLVDLPQEADSSVDEEELDVAFGDDEALSLA